jgi:dipeptidyl aminopeptidase/acylaminoacyl peptidase
MFILAACSSAVFFAANAPVHFEKSQLVCDVVYDDAHDLKLDIYRPLNEREKHDVLVFFYGGRWETGSKDQYAFAADAFVKRGFIVVIPDYRKYPAVKFPAFAQDGAKAVGWVLDHIEDYHGDKNRVFVAGHSAGAHIGSLIVSDAKYLRAEHHAPGEIKAFAGLAGPYSFTPEDEDLKDMFGPPENYAAMQTTSFIDGDEPPMLLLWGEQDKTVARYNLDRLKEKIEENHGTVVGKTYPSLDHIKILGALSWFNRNDAPVAEDMDRFFRTGKVKP